MTASGGPAGSALPVLMYHSISSIDHGPLRSLAVSATRFAEQLSALDDAGYRMVGLSEALDLLDATAVDRSNRPCPPLVALTFDDGYADFRTAALPLLEAAGARATLYPSVGHLGQAPAWLGRWADEFGPLLDWAQLAEVAESGHVEIGSHGLLHHPLDVLPPQWAADEITVARDRLEQHLGSPVRSFCYPHGYHDWRVRAAVRRAGHDNACEVGRRRYRPGDRRLAVPRLLPTGDHDAAALLDLVRTGGPRMIPQAKRLAQPAWRLTRRVARRTGRQLT
ncbi:polysaccharide deacetylase family protein [Micromonospora sp. NBC_01813]|uniref:polysaccharide deacetylase family protein n=1 Tax=Micromonospora sp. NBC_01813 TaxID=2975988 RepID=UPI002DD90C5F|nr:polysaccharide deacetylase family protein [Micromonospora sp. NBC_01813]WSA12017.1 polysaccharide deacetylase family protein [Micromonospora sp. NBC_01813]